MIVVLDADILSSLAKIKRLSLIKSLFPEYEIVGSSLFCMGNAIALLSTEADYMRGVLNVERP